VAESARRFSVHTGRLLATSRAMTSMRILLLTVFLAWSPLWAEHCRCAEPVKPVETPNAAEKPARDQRKGLRLLFEKLVCSAPAANASFSPGYAVQDGRMLTYNGKVEEVDLARSGNSVGEVSRKEYAVIRTIVIQPMGGGLGRTWISTLRRITSAKQIGKDRLATFRDRPSRGMRVGATQRRLSVEGLEPGAGDDNLRVFLAPVPEMPRLPQVKLQAGRPFARNLGQVTITWELLYSANLEGRSCWVLCRRLGLKAGAHPGARYESSIANYLVDAQSGIILGGIQEWDSRSGKKTGMSIHSFKLVTQETSKQKLDAQRKEIAADRELLRAVSNRNVPQVERLLRAEKKITGNPRPCLAFARSFCQAEKDLARVQGGARRVALVPEDSMVFISAPAKLKKGQKLIPVVFLHGAAAHAETYFKDWSGRVADRPLLLIFPQARDWTWNVATDASMIGSLLGVLGRTYNLDRSRLVFAGHSAGGEMAMLLGYGASFPGFQNRGVVAAGAGMPDHFRSIAFKKRPGDMLARLRSVDAMLLGGEKDKIVRQESLRNLFRWLRTYNKGGVSLTLSKDVALRYHTDWTELIIKWVLKLPAERKAETAAAGPGL
jgi:poly(3-hydroxybutyrate) depolymerase